MILEIDIAVRQTTPEQTAVAVLLLLVAGAILTAATWRLRWVGLGSESRKRHKQALSGQIESLTPGSVRIVDADRLADRRPDIWSSWDHSGAVEDVTTVREAASKLWSVGRGVWGPRLAIFPPVARRALVVGVLAFVWGSVAVAADGIAASLKSSSSIRSPLEWPGIAIEETVIAIDIAADLGAHIPGATAVWDFGFALLVLAGSTLYQNFVVVAIVLLQAGLLAHLLLRHVDERERLPVSLPDAHDAGRVTASVVAGLWAATLGVIGLGRVAGSTSTGRTAGAWLIVLGSVVAAVYLGIRLRRGLHAVRRWHAESDVSRLQRAELVVRVFASVATAVVAPVLLVWVVVGVSNLPMLVEAWLAAPVSTQLVTAIVAAALVAGMAHSVREAAPDVRESLVEVASRRSVQTAIFARGLPVGMIAVVAILASALGAPTALAVIVGVLAGAGTRVAYQRAMRLKHRARAFDSADPSASRVVIHAYPLEDDDGETHFFARVNGTEVCHPDREAAVDAVVAAARDHFDAGEVRPMVERSFARDLLDDGVVDIDVTRERLRSDVRRTAEGRLRREGMVEADELEATLSEAYPGDVWREEMRRLREGPLRRRRGHYHLA